MKTLLIFLSLAMATSALAIDIEKPRYNIDFDSRIEQARNVVSEYNKDLAKKEVAGNTDDQRPESVDVIDFYDAEIRWGKNRQSAGN